VDDTISSSSPTKSAVATDWLLQLEKKMDEEGDEEEEDDDSNEDDIIHNDYPTDEKGDMLGEIQQRREDTGMPNNNSNSSNNEGDYNNTFERDRLYELERRIKMTKSVEECEDKRWIPSPKSIRNDRCIYYCLQSNDDTSVVENDQEEDENEKIMGEEGRRISDDVLIREYAKLLLRRSSNNISKKRDSSMRAMNTAVTSTSSVTEKSGEHHTRMTTTATNTIISCPPLALATATTCTAITNTMIRRSNIIGIFMSFIIVMIISYLLLVNAAVLGSATSYSSSCEVAVNPIYYSYAIILVLQSFLSIGAIVISIITLIIVTKVKV
jgi:hypothetical protein